jgi:hypothetical protein
MEITLRKYVSAYEQRNIQDLLAVWPNLQNDKKEYERTKKHFNDGNVSNEHMSLQPLETQVLKEDAIVRCERLERFAKTETSDGGGDLMRDRMPTQNPGPHNSTKDVKRKDNVWVKLHKDNDQWVITSVSSKQPSL